jgi:CDP-diacylglycerol--glycerol-3-phosphate 3-phosphatidyltransferase
LFQLRFGQRAYNENTGFTRIMEDNVLAKMREALNLNELWYPSNQLSVVRLALVGPTVYYLLHEERTDKALGLLLLGMATDAVDGPLARRRGEVSELGKVIDPLADKLTLDAVAVALSMRRGFPWWVTKLLLVRDAGIVAGSMLIFRKSTYVTPSLYTGKVTTAMLTAALLQYLLDMQPWGRRTLIATLVPLAVSWSEYGWRFWQWVNEQEAEQRAQASVDGLLVK